MSDESAQAQQGFGPAIPSPSASVALRPLGRDSVTITSGLLHQWQERNRSASLPLALRQLETAGNLANLRLAINRDEGDYRGPQFMDSDLYKTLEAIAWEVSRFPSEPLTSFAAQATELLEAAQQPDGYLNSYVQVTGRPRYANLAYSHELYCAGHLIQAGVAAQRSQGTGGSALFAVARRFADHLVKEFLGTHDGLDGHPIVETALVELYRETGDEEYLRLASQFVEQRGHGLIGDSGFGSRYLQDHLPVREANQLSGHAVRALYLEAGVVDLATETGDVELLAGSAVRWDDMVSAKTCLTGSVGSRHSGESFGDRFELPPDRAYNETCASIASFQWSWRLLLATGDSKYADLMERVLYNGFAAATSTEGDRFFYVNPLQRREDHYEGDEPARRRRWYSCACCPPNIMRTLRVPGALSRGGGRRYPAPASLHRGAGQHQPCWRHPRLGHGHRLPLVRHGHPAGDQRVPPAECGLAIRVPGWSSSPRFLLNDAPVAATVQHGYLVIRRQWQPGDVVTCDFAAVPRLTYPSRRIDALRGTVAIERGPLVYCAEQADQPAGLDLEDLALRPGELRDARSHGARRGRHDPGRGRRRGPAAGDRAGAALQQRARRAARRRPGHRHRHPLLPVGQPRRRPHARLDAAGGRRQPAPRLSQAR